MKAWEEAGLRFRMGPLSWHTHEDHKPSSQLLALEAAAVAVHLLETNTVIGRGPDAAFFLPPRRGHGRPDGSVRIVRSITQPSTISLYEI